MDLEKAKFNMVEQQILPFSLVSSDIIDLFMNTRREQFILPEFKSLAFADVEIPLISQGKMFCPKIEALVLQNLELNDKCKVLEIGTGSGYLTYLMSCLSKFVYSFEYNEENSQFAVRNIMNISVKNISIINKNGFLGSSEFAPFERILVGGAVKNLCDLEELKSELALDGILIGMVGNSQLQEVVKIRRVGNDEFKMEKLHETNIEFLCYENSCNTKFNL